MNDVIERLNKATKENPLSRNELSRMFGSERKARTEIQRLRLQGHRICAVNDGKGYWIAKSESEYKDFRRYYMSYPLTTFRTIKAMDGFTEGQVEL